MGLSFRTATADDGAALLALVHAAYRGDESKAGWTTEAELLGGQRTDGDELDGILASPTSRMLIAETEGDRSGDLLACCLIERRDDGTAYLGMFSVRPDRQGGGVGRAVVAEAERIAAEEWSAASMRMLVIRQRLELIAWYERLGYHRTGKTEPFPYGDIRFGLPKVDDLEFIELAKPLGA